jgi:LysR family glycine cleavage system transcriptional activator
MSALAAFDASARTGSFSEAARELNLTQGAISRQIRVLEQQLDTLLFVRESRRVRLTSAGQAYAMEIRAALHTIGYATLKLLNDPSDGVINLAILPTFGAQWLIPRLVHFWAERPNIAINFATRSDPFDFTREGLDAAIHYGAPEWPGADCYFLFGEKIAPVCSPLFLADERRRTITPEGLINLPLLHLTHRPFAWQEWLEKQGVNAMPTKGFHFEQFNAAIQAAKSGLGIALLPEPLIEEEIKRGDLIKVLGEGEVSDKGYYLVIPKEKLSLPAIQIFKKWLTEQATQYSR